MPGWTAAQILTLAPDDASAKAGKGLAGPGKWSGLGADDGAVWGKCKGSGSNPYETRIDLSEPAFKCTCPSRKFPCKHSIGLFLLYADRPGEFKETERPGWVADWLATRSDRAAKKVERAEEKAKKEADPEEIAKREERSAKTAAKREERVAQGAEQLDLWLRDLVRGGLSRAQSQPREFWRTTAARMVDAQAPGLGRFVRDMAFVPSSGQGWPDRLLVRMARVHLLLKAFARIDSLPEPMREDVRTLVWKSQTKEEALAGEAALDRWNVLDRRVEELDDGPIRMQETWLLGERTRRPALLLSFAAPGKPFDVNLPAGAAFETKLAFFPSNFPLRAILAEEGAVAEPFSAEAGFDGFAEAFGAFADALAAHPWIERFPMFLREAALHRAGEAWIVRDRAGRTAPAKIDAPSGWDLLAATGGAFVPIFGLWEEDAFRPRASFEGGRYAPATR